MNFEIEFATLVKFSEGSEELFQEKLKDIHENTSDKNLFRFMSFLMAKTTAQDALHKAVMNRLQLQFEDFKKTRDMNSPDFMTADERKETTRLLKNAKAYYEVLVVASKCMETLARLKAGGNDELIDALSMARMLEDTQELARIDTLLDLLESLDK